MRQIAIGEFRDWVNNTGYREPYLTVADDMRTTFMFTEDHSKFRDKKGIYRGGGNFQLYKQGYESSLSEPAAIYRSGAPKTPAYVGSFRATPPIAVPYRSPTPLDAYGPELYNKAKPDHQTMNLGNSFYELRELPAMIKQKFTPDLRGASNYWLAEQFGWKPLLKDCRDLYNTQINMSQTIQQLLRDNGRPVHRKVKLNRDSSNFENIVDTWTSDFPEVEPALVTQCYAGPATHKLAYFEAETIWLSGEFRFWLPPEGSNWIDRSLWTANIRARLFGLYPSPANIYRAMPWSWLIDWFSNIGDNIDNLNTNVVDRLINNYAFAMRKREVGSELRAEWTMNDHHDNPIQLHATTRSLTRRLERLDSVSPFGFRFKDEGLSPMQESILGALLGRRRY